MRRIQHIPTSMIECSDLDPSVTISVSFGDKTCRSTLQTTVQLSQTLRSFLQPKHLQICDRFDQFRLVSHDQIEAKFGLTKEDYVRQRIAEVARTIQFMDATGLKLCTDEIYGYQTYSKEQRLPGQDHAVTWFNPETRALVMMDEPYGYVDQIFKHRKDWAYRHGFEIHRLDWGGTYRPEKGSVCDLVCRAGEGALVGQIVDRLTNVGLGFREDTAAWTLHCSP